MTPNTYIPLTRDRLAELLEPAVSCATKGVTDFKTVAKVAGIIADCAEKTANKLAEQKRVNDRYPEHAISFIEIDAIHALNKAYGIGIVGSCAKSVIEKSSHYIEIFVDDVIDIADAE